MNLEVQQETFAPAIQAAARVVPSRTTLSALTGILLEAKKESLLLKATDLDMGIEIEIPAKVDTDGSILLPARYLTEITRHIPDGTISITVDDNDSAILRWSESEFVIHGRPVADFPGFPETGNATTIPLTREGLRLVLESTIFAASQDETRPILTGINISIENNKLNAISTDGFRISNRVVPIPYTEIDPVSIVLPVRSLNELLRALSPKKNINVLISDNHVYFETGYTRIYSRLLNGTYPSVMDLVPNTFSTKVQVDRSKLHDACERVSLLSDPLQKSWPITLTCEADRVVLSASSASVGRAREEIPAETTGESTEIIFNSRFLAEGLRSCSSTEALLEISGSLTASRLTFPEEDGFVYIVMPMRPTES